MDLEFRKPRSADVEEIASFKQEFQDNNSGMDGTGILYRSTPEEWLEYIDKLEASNDPNSIPCLQYGLYETNSNRLLGLTQIRLELKGYLVDFGGHIGYCVRPSERRNGYAKTMLKAALNICRNQGLGKVLITCLEDNIGSAKTIESCGGILEKIVYDNSNYKANMKRFWILL